MLKMLVLKKNLDVLSVCKRVLFCILLTGPFTQSILSTVTMLRIPASPASPLNYCSPFFFPYSEDWFLLDVFTVSHNVVNPLLLILSDFPTAVPLR